MPPTSPRLIAVSNLLWLLCSLMHLKEHSENVLLSVFLSLHVSPSTSWEDFYLRKKGRKIVPELLFDVK